MMEKQKSVSWSLESPTVDNVGTYWWLAICEPGGESPREAGVVEIGYEFGLLTYAFHGYDKPMPFVTGKDGICTNCEGHIMYWCGPIESPLDEGRFPALSAAPAMQ